MKRSIIAIGILGCIFTQAQVAKKDTATTKKIDEVTLTKKVFQKKSDRFVYDVAASPVAKGNTALTLLKETPMVSSTDDKTLTIAGKSNAIIYINGRKTQMNADALMAFLKNTPAENIQKIEVITMPGSEYQVESSDGIINIILKKRTDDGLNGNVRMSNTQDAYNNTSASASLNYRKGKLGISSNFNMGDETQKQQYTLKNGNSTSSSQSFGYMTDPNKNYGGYLNVDYALTEKSNLALSYNTWYNKSYNSVSDLFNTIGFYDEDNKWANSYNRTKSIENAQSYNNSVNLNYELKTDSLGSKLNINAAYLNYHRGQNSINTTINSDENGTLLYRPDNSLQILNNIVQSTPQTINNFSGMVDYVQKFKNDFSVAIGGNYNHTKTDNNTLSYTDAWNPVNNSFNRKNNPNHFLYTENIYGMYLTLEKKFSDKLSGKAGVRYEITNSVGESPNAQDANMQLIKRDYNNILPYLSLNYAINKDNNISYAFSSRTRRPSFWELNPVRIYLTQFNYVQNNPFVKASSTYNQELTYMYKNSYYLIASHSMYNDMIQQIPLQRERTVELPKTDASGQPILDGNGNPEVYQTSINELRYIRTNFGKKQSFTFTAGMQKSFFKGYWNTNLNIGVQYNKLNGQLDTDPLTGDQFTPYVNHNSSTSFTMQTNNNIRLDKEKTWYAGVNFWYVGKQQIELGVLNPLSSLDLSLKKILGDWTFMATVSDILDTNKVTINQPKGNANYNYVNNYMYNRQLEVSVTYNFGNKKVKKIRSFETAADAIKNRTK